MKIYWDKLSKQQISNFNAAIKAYDERNLISSPRPPVLYVELTKNCMGRCVFCRDPHWVNDPAYDMSRENFDILLRDYVPYSILVDLRGGGESLTLPDFSDYVAKVARFGPRIRLTTTLGCGTRKALQSLIDNDVFVSVSFDAADKKTFEDIRSKVSYDTVIKNLEFLARGMLEKYGTLSDKMRLGIYPLQKKNLNHVKGILQLAQRIKIPEIVIGPLASSTDDPNNLHNNIHRTMAALYTCVTHAKRKGMKFTLGTPPFDRFYFKDKVFDLCCHPWLYALIGHEGNLSYCDNALGENADTLGHITEGVQVTWNGPKAQKVRSLHRERKCQEMWHTCRKCYGDGRYSDHEHEINERFCKWVVTEKDIEKRIFTPFAKKLYNLNLFGVKSDIAFMMKDIIGRICRRVYILIFGLKRYIPRGIYESSWDFVDAYKKKNGSEAAQCVEIYPAYYVDVSMPEKLRIEIPHYYRKLLIPQKKPALVVTSIPHGRLWVTDFDVAVISDDDLLIGDVSFQWGKGVIPPQNNGIFKRRYLDRPRLLHKTVFTMLTGGGGNRFYYHWLYDVLPRLHLLKKSGLYDKVDLFLVPRHDLKFQRDTLEMLGITSDKVIDSSAYKHIQADLLIVSSHPNPWPPATPRWVYDYLRDSFISKALLKTKTGSHDYIYISRLDATNRKIINEDSIIDLMKEYGFEIFSLGNMSFADQVALFSSAKVVAGGHGAGLCNIVFCTKGARVVEFFSEGYVNNVFYDMCQSLELEYHYMVCKSHSRPASDNLAEGVKEDITVDLTELARLLELSGLRK
ncbi:MAG: glycosyltransferase 61 family protein [Candidatus Omnitrophica bacterium]|nr:glycosyltransferase 61 family protein [Candidatus Omnitrophota bacterium]